MRAIVISASSDIGAAMCHRWKLSNWNVCGTYRTNSQQVEQLKQAGVELVSCTLEDRDSVLKACEYLKTGCHCWDILVLCPGTQEPVGEFAKCDIDEWEQGIVINFTQQLRIVHELLPLRNEKSELGPIVLFFAGGGTNNAPLNYSSYIVSKIALIKMCELLDAEIPDTRFAIVGPGWVKTKIHQSTLMAGDKAGDNYERTKHKLSGNACTPMDDVLACCDWIINSPHNIVSGRNFSVVFDAWGQSALNEELKRDPQMYKLRRFGNDWEAKRISK